MHFLTIDSLTWINFPSRTLGRPSLLRVDFPSLSNQDKPLHCNSIWITSPWVMKLKMAPFPLSTTGRLFIRYLERSSSTVSNESVCCTEMKGAQRKDPAISETWKSSNACKPLLDRIGESEASGPCRWRWLITQQPTLSRWLRHHYHYTSRNDTNIQTASDRATMSLQPQL